jgi:HK97 family phage prohead protease
MPNFLSDNKFREFAREKFPQKEDGKNCYKLDEANDMAGIRKQFVAEVKVQNDEARELLFTVSTSGVDRQGDSISVDGWRLDNYRKNPVVLWAHSYNGFPIARSSKIWVEDGKLKSIASFVPENNSAVGRQAEGIYQLYKGGFLSATSVGFMPIKWAWTEDTSRKYGIDFEEQELLEYSAVPVPANAEALIESRGMVDVNPVIEWALETIFPKGINRRKFERFLSDSGFSQKEAVTLAALTPKDLSQSDSENEIRECLSVLQQFRETLK